MFTCARDAGSPALKAATSMSLCAKESTPVQYLRRNGDVLIALDALQITLIMSVF